jgi:hypothetical protein
MGGQEEDVRERCKGVNYFRSWLEWKLQINGMIASSGYFF